MVMSATCKTSLLLVHASSPSYQRPVHRGPGVPARREQASSGCWAGTGRKNSWALFQSCRKRKNKTPTQGEQFPTAWAAGPLSCYLQRALLGVTQLLPRCGFHPKTSSQTVGSEQQDTSFHSVKMPWLYTNKLKRHDNKWNEHRICCQRHGRSEVLLFLARYIYMVGIWCHFPPSQLLSPLTYTTHTHTHTRTHTHGHARTPIPHTQV